MKFAYSPEEILELAIKIEETGKVYYESFATRTKDTQVAEIFHYLADQEKQHREVFLKIYGEFEQGDIFGVYDQEEVSAYLRALVESKLFIKSESVMALINQAKDADEVIMHAVTFEKDTILYFSELGELLKEKYRAIVNKLISEEKSHVIKLLLLRESLRTKKMSH